MTDVLLDAWSLTRVEELPGRPLPERWLHGVEAAEPDLYVAWREEVNEILIWDGRTKRLAEAARGLLKAVYDKHRILARSHRRRLSDLLANEARLAEATSVLPPDVGGLDGRGMLEADKWDQSLPYDVAAG